MSNKTSVKCLFFVAQDDKIKIKSEKSWFDGCRAHVIYHTLNADPKICKQYRSNKQVHNESFFLQRNDKKGVAFCFIYLFQRSLHSTNVEGPNIVMEGGEVHQYIPMPGLYIPHSKYVTQKIMENIW